MIKKMRENIHIIIKKLVDEIIDKMYERLADDIVSLIFWIAKLEVLTIFISILMVIQYILR